MKFVISSKVCATKTYIYHLRNKTKITQISLDIKITEFERFCMRGWCEILGPITWQS